MCLVDKRISERVDGLISKHRVDFQVYSCDLR